MNKISIPDLTEEQKRVIMWVGGLLILTYLISILSGTTGAGVLASGLFIFNVIAGMPWSLIALQLTDIFKNNPFSVIFIVLIVITPCINLFLFFWFKNGNDLKGLLKYRPWGYSNNKKVIYHYEEPNDKS